MSAAQRSGSESFESMARTLEIACAGLDGCCDDWTADRVDPARFVPTPGMERARRELEAALATAEGPVVLSGPAGHGKSLLLRRFVAAPPPDFRTRFLPFANLEPIDLCLWLASLSGCGRPRDPEAALDELLRGDSLSELRVLLAIDEVQAMPRETGRWLAERAERCGAQLLMAGLPGPALDALLSALPPTTREVTLYESWEPSDAEWLLARAERSGLLAPGELAEVVDAGSAVRAAQGNPRLVLRNLAEHLRAARLEAEIERAASRAAEPEPAPGVATPAPEPVPAPAPMPAAAATALPSRSLAMEMQRMRAATVSRLARMRTVSANRIARARTASATRLARMRTVSANRIAQASAASAGQIARARTASAGQIDRVRMVSASHLARARASSASQLARARARAHSTVETAAVALPVLARSGRDRTAAAGNALANQVRWSSSAVSSASRALAARVAASARTAFSVSGRDPLAPVAGPALAAASALACAIALLSVWEPPHARDSRGGVVAASIAGEPAAWVRAPSSVSAAATARPVTAVSAAAAARPVTVQVNAHPWAVVSVNGERVGATPFSVALAPGVHRFRAELSDGRVLEREERVTADGHPIAFP